MAPGLSTELLAGQLARGAPATSLRGTDGGVRGRGGAAGSGSPPAAPSETHHRSSPWLCSSTEYPKKVPVPPRNSSGCRVSRL